MTVIKPSPIQQSTVVKKLFSYLGFLLLLVPGFLSAGCFPRQDTRKELDFLLTLPETWAIADVSRMDTDEDGENEWVVLYAFDDPGDRDVIPIKGAIYDINRREPRLPIVYPYHLQAPGWTFLGEGLGKVTVRVEDVVTIAPSGIAGSANEVIVENTGPNKEINRVSIYRWIDSIPSDIRKRTDPHEILLVQGRPVGKGEWYQCIGMFAGTLRVSLDQADRVTVVDAHNDRSQLATFRIYSPKSQQNGYLDAHYELVRPDSVCIDFAHGKPPNLATSPYPEKIVMGYHYSLNNEPLTNAQYLTQNAKTNQGNDAWRIFSLGTRDACVKRISYTPADQTASEVQSYGETDDPTATSATPIPIRAVVQTTATYKLPGTDQPQPIQIEWTLVRESAPPGEPDEWKIDNIEIR
jgi:hypothetical protein